MAGRREGYVRGDDEGVSAADAVAVAAYEVGSVRAATMRMGFDRTGMALDPDWVRDMAKVYSEVTIALQEILFAAARDRSADLAAGERLNVPDSTGTGSSDAQIRKAGAAAARAVDAALGQRPLSADVRKNPLPFSLGSRAQDWPVPGRAFASSDPRCPTSFTLPVNRAAAT